MRRRMRQRTNTRSPLRMMFTESISMKRSSEGLLRKCLGNLKIGKVGKKDNICYTFPEIMKISKSKGMKE